EGGANKYPPNPAAPGGPAGARRVARQTSAPPPARTTGGSSSSSMAACGGSASAQPGHGLADSCVHRAAGRAGHETPPAPRRATAGSWRPQAWPHRRWRCQAEPPCTDMLLRSGLRSSTPTGGHGRHEGKFRRFDSSRLGCRLPPTRIMIRLIDFLGSPGGAAAASAEAGGLREAALGERAP
ncbi:unnamed protein product, partial [Prorocentrum cordatum]